MSYDFFLDKVGRVCVDKLSDSYCREYIKDILNLINCIPYINSSFNQILSQEEDYYKNKWNYSYTIFKLYIGKWVNVTIFFNFL